ncbi:MAG: 50S ribosomal protein L35 [Candidatus Latescibacterota bacterium]|nr:MAG: 50S ribosomal protein L35 [Candidatus Latescibacterota bacterium]RKY71017.1 MAG: 50S ribosomal protein L35 [Candidatus Latescibacterota bacterium]
MPKMKSNRGAAKRFKTTGTGRIRRSRASVGHLLSKKTSRRKRELRKSGFVSASDMQRIRRLICV